MINEDRLHHMIKMAVFDANDGKKCKPMAQYTRYDFVSMQLLRSFVTGTVAFVLIAGLWALSKADNLIEGLPSMDIGGLLITLLAVYAIFMLVYMLLTYTIYSLKYTVGRRKVKQFYNNVKKVNASYTREEKIKMPEQTEEDWN